jgi:SMC interacting uncharacterized protein involved in chromosome segregation
MKKYILPIIIILLFGWLVCNKVEYYGLSDQFRATQDSLVAAVDSMQLEIAKDDSAIAILDKKDDSLQYVIDHQKAKIKTIVQYVEVESVKIDEFSEVELVSSFYKRYPKDTVTNPLPVAQPVLVSAAKGLVELDGAKQIIVVKDSVIASTENRVAVKDSVISLYISKENNYKNIMNNQQTQIKDWKFQYSTLQLENAKLKAKNKFTKIGAGLIAGGLVYLMIAK